ncbi:hypothetical protein OPIT5_13115 [Opitutaceae bacterium TAV5]|nr:hypothetical protein OPIT5_13115 [Opitutaceae bacterium TAV5]
MQLPIALISARESHDGQNDFCAFFAAIRIDRCQRRTLSTGIPSIMPFAGHSFLFRAKGFDAPARAA